MISRPGLVLAPLIGATLVFACTTPPGDEVVLARRPEAPPILVAPDSGLAPSDIPKEALELCPSTTCPAPLLTCVSSKYLCDIDSLSDDKNCGGCEVVCAGDAPELFGLFGCVGGKCALTCHGNHADCDGVPDNGCEAALDSNANCGACGNKCASPDMCQDGTCKHGCPPGLTLCAGTCVDLTKSDQHCGACGVECPERPAGSPRPPPHSYYGCGASACGVLKCDNRDAPTEWTDCNQNLSQPGSDGCEVDLSNPSVEHCGKCEIACAPGQKCGVREGSGLFVAYSCLCGPGETNCGKNELDETICAVLDTNALHCGACGRQCPGAMDLETGLGAIPNATGVCRSGACGISCSEGWADCNGFDGDGCETNIRQDPANCGGCGLACSGGASQACVSGRCVVEDCVEKKPQ